MIGGLRVNKKSRVWSDDALDGLAAIILIALFVTGIVYWLETLPP